jgi:dihydroorotase
MRADVSGAVRGQLIIRIQAVDASVEYLMTLYLHESITADEIRRAAAHGLVGVKMYPHGVTTNSDHGVVSFASFYPVFRAMEECGLVLNIHGEVPSDHTKVDPRISPSCLGTKLT